MISLEKKLVAAGTIPSILVLAFGFLDGLSLALTITLATGTLLFGMTAVWMGIKVWESATARFTNRKEAARISEQIAELSKCGICEIDAGMAATIWSGARHEDPSIVWYLRFRQIKAALNEGDISPTKLNGEKANLRSWMTVKELRRYFVSRGIIPSDAAEDGRPQV